MRTQLRTALHQNLTSCSLAKHPISAYCEPFCGALGAFLAVYDVLLEHGVTHIQLQDINPILIQIYTLTHQQPTVLSHALLTLEKPFNALLPKTPPSKEQLKGQLASANAYFNQIKAQFNTHKGSTSVEQCARFLFLQTHSFNGVYRENSKGQYNTPFNWSPKPAPSMQEKIQALHAVFTSFASVSLVCSPFESTPFEPHTLYYLDPPYANAQSSENAYHQDGFSMQKQLQLIDSIAYSPFIYSNHAHPDLLAVFAKKPQLTVHTLSRTNIMSAKAQTRSAPMLEILVSQSAPLPVAPLA